MAMKVADQLNLLGNPVLQLNIEQLAADPGTPTLSRIYFNTTDSELRVYNGTAWVTLGGGSAMSANDILAALLNVDGSGSNLDADLLDGLQASAFALAAHNHTSSEITDFNAAVNALINTAIVDGAPGALDTLNELAAALGDDANFAANVSADIATRTRAFSQQVGDGSATSFAVTHNLNTTRAIVQVYEVATGEVVLCQVVRNNANQHTVTFASAPSNNEFEVVVIG
ncbi:MAG: hypothetical protein AAFR07_05670 [Pseudomonadota bacterium]